ncbi:MAG: GntR family transcriptional regulator [Anaerolineaceae bacterium]|nr:GntR family transcriptional regulator [Anaerolineaceae bacterium]
MAVNETLHPFQRLQQELAVLIAETPAGERLVSEPELAHQLGVSRATLREAMRTFEGQGLIRRRQGVGTFVVGRSQVLDSGLEILESIETMAGRIGLDVSMGALRIQLFKADKTHTQIYQLPEGTEMVKVSRVILAENRPVAYLVDELPADVLTSEELQNGFTGSVLDFFVNKGQIKLSKSFTDIQAVAATPEIAKKLEIQRGDVLLLFVARLYSESGEIVDFSHSYFLPGYFRFHVVRTVGENLFSSARIDQ